jgi:hypothetical protein
MPESGKPAQAIECLADIRKFGGASSATLVFDSEQLDGGNEQKAEIPFAPGHLLQEGYGNSLRIDHGIRLCDDHKKNFAI